MGCGYRFASLQDCPTISLPYVGGDERGLFTAALIREIECSGAFQYVNAGGELELIVKMFDFREENIGFRYDVNKHGQLTNSLVPAEMRFSTLAEVTVFDTQNGCILLGPIKVASHVDFDHDYFKVRDGQNVFSLGQLTGTEEAKEAASPLLYRKMAEKIVTYLRFM